MALSSAKLLSARKGTFSDEKSGLSFLQIYFNSPDHHWNQKIVIQILTPFEMRFSDLISRFEVVCPMQKDSKKPLPTHIWAMKNGIPVHEYRKPSAKLPSGESPSDTIEDPGTVDQLIDMAGKNFDIAIVVDFGYMLPSKLISAFSKTPILMHPSLLPKYRGAAPIERCIMEGDEESGVTVLDVAPSKFDAGSILLSRKKTLDPRALGTQIKEELSELGAKTLVEALERYEELQHTKIAQKNDASKAPKLAPVDFLAPWKTKEPIGVYNHWRAIGPLTTHLFGCKHMKIHSQDGSVPVLIHELIHPSDQKPTKNLDENANIGTIAYDKPKNLLWVKCAGKRNWIAAKSLQLESGRRVVDATSFVNGIQLSVNPSQHFDTVGL